MPSLLAERVNLALGLTVESAWKARDSHRALRAPAELHPQPSTPLTTAQRICEGSFVQYRKL